MRKIGKEVYEHYLYMIISESGIFDECIPEQEYAVHKEMRRTADVMCRKGNDFIFFDSKAFTPKIAMRTFSQDAFDSDVERLAKDCKKLYTHIRKRFKKEYNFFKETKDEVDENIFGMVVVQEDPYIIGEVVYKKTAEMLGIGKDNSEYAWLCKHISIVGIYDVERFCFAGCDMIPPIKEHIAQQRYAGNCLRICPSKNNTYTRFTTFSDQLTKEVIKGLREIQARYS